MTQPSLSAIMSAVLDSFGIDKDYYKAIMTTRANMAVEIRQAVCFLGQKFGYSQSNIGKFLHIDHSTVCYNRRKLIELCDIDREYACKVDKALSIISNSLEMYKETTFSGWLTRDEDGSLTFFAEKPIREEFSDGEGFWSGECPRELNPSLYPLLTWKSEPQECEVTIKLKSYGGV